MWHLLQISYCEYWQLNFPWTGNVSCWILSEERGVQQSGWCTNSKRGSGVQLATRKPMLTCSCMETRERFALQKWWWWWWSWWWWWWWRCCSPLWLIMLITSIYHWWPLFMASCFSWSGCCCLFLLLLLGVLFWGVQRLGTSGFYKWSASSLSKPVKSHQVSTRSCRWMHRTTAVIICHLDL